MTDMPPLFIEILVQVFFVLLVGLMLSLVFIVVMHVLMPKNVLKTYFKEPYFRPGEIAIFTGFPFGYMRTAMFNRVLGFPSSGKKRGLENAYKIAPVWYCRASKYFIIFLVPTFALLILSGGVIYIYSLLYPLE